jgi:hypothetical protein
MVEAEQFKTDSWEEIHLLWLRHCRETKSRSAVPILSKTRNENLTEVFAHGFQKGQLSRSSIANPFTTGEVAEIDCTGSKD